MLFFKLPAAAIQITVTDTATSLKKLIEAAVADGEQYQFPTFANAVQFQSENGNIRYCADGNIPLLDKGIILYQQGLDNTVRASDLNKLILISKDGGGDIKVNIQMGAVDENV